MISLLVPLSMAAEGEGCSSTSRSAAPEVAGDWILAYDDLIEVTLKVGGSEYQSQVNSQGGLIEVTHQGRSLRFALDCARPEIVCPSEAWPERLSIEQRDVQYEHRMIVTVAEQRCSQPLLPAQPDSCGEGTINPNCQDVCEGEILVSEQERFGVIGEDGANYRFYLGAGIGSNGANCALVGLAWADAVLVNSGSEESDTWRSEEMTDGQVHLAYGGGCLWAGNATANDPELASLVAGASIHFYTGFSGSRL